MNINGYKKNNCSYNNLNNKYYCKNNFKNCCNNCCNNKFNINNLYEIEKFLCDLRNTCRCIKFYKFLK